MMRTINTASIGLIIFIKAADKNKDKTTIYTYPVEGVYTKEINNTEEIKKQDSRRKNTISVIN